MFEDKQIIKEAEDQRFRRVYSGAPTAC